MGQVKAVLVILPGRKLVVDVPTIDATWMGARGGWTSPCCVLGYDSNWKINFGESFAFFWDQDRTSIFSSWVTYSSGKCQNLAPLTISILYAWLGSGGLGCFTAIYTHAVIGF